MLFKPAWMNAKLDSRTYRQNRRIIRSIDRIQNVDERLKVVCASPHISARQYVLERLPLEKVFEFAMHRFPEGFYETLKEQYLAKQRIMSCILDRFQKIPIVGQRQELAASFRENEDGMRTLQDLSIRSENPDVRQFAEERWTKCQTMLSDRMKFAKMTDEDRIADYLRGVRLNSVFTKHSLYEALYKRNAQSVVSPKKFREILADSRIDVHVRAYIAGVETFKIGSKENVEILIQQLLSGEAAGNSNHPVVSALYDRALHMFSKDQLDHWEQTARNGAPKPDYGE